MAALFPDFRAYPYIDIRSPTIACIALQFDCKGQAPPNPLLELKLESPLTGQPWWRYPRATPLTRWGFEKFSGLPGFSNKTIP